jgi:hypothetical protein
MYKLAPLLIAIIMLSSCGAGSSFSAEDKKTVTDEVRQTLYNYYTDINKSGLMAELSYLDTSADFFWVPPAYSDPISYADVEMYIKRTAPIFKSVNNRWDTLRITALTKNLASYTGKLYSTITDTSGTKETYSLIETGLLIKRDDGWKLLNGQTSTLHE